MKTVPHYPTLVFDEIAKENFIGSQATLEDIERGLSSKHEVTRNKWHSVALVRGLIQ